MNNEVLIKAVYDKPPVWDRKDKLHNNRDVVEHCWKEISQIMKENPMQVRKKWKYLRDQFGVELGKILMAEEEGYHYKPKWRFYHAMLFLKDVVKPRPPQITSFSLKTDGRKSKKKKESSSDDMCSDSMDSCADDNFDPLPLQVLIESSPPQLDAPNSQSNTPAMQIETPNIQIEAPATQIEMPATQIGAHATQIEAPAMQIEASATRIEAPATEIEASATQTETLLPQAEKRNLKRRISPNSFNEAMLEIEKRKLELLQERSSPNVEKDDDHVHFFKSLITHVRKIPGDKVLVFRNRVQDLVAHFAYQVPLPRDSLKDPGQNMTGYLKKEPDD